MTQNEVDIIKNAVLDATEAYVDARLNVLDFVKTQIGVTVGNPVQRQGKYYHTVRCNATQSTPNGVTYNNVLSVGNIPFPNGSVVFVAAPNAQFSSQFILGKLDNTPCNISAGSITLGDAIYLTSTPESDGSYGHLAKFKIYNSELKVDDAILSGLVIGCGKINQSANTGGIVNMVGGNNRNYILIANTGSPTQCGDGIMIHGWKSNVRGLVEAYGTNNNKLWDRSLYNIPEKTIYEDSDGYLHWA